MSTCALVVPTAGDRPYLPDLIRAAGLPPERVIVVRTADVDLDLPATIIDDFGPPNIQRWWNRGIAATDAEHVAILNDDLTIPETLLPAMSGRLDMTGASICYVGTDAPVPCLTGWAFMLNTTHPIRPDERFCWYWGDNDLHRQAIAGAGITHVPIHVGHHHPGETTQARSDLQELAEADRDTFVRKWG